MEEKTCKNCKYFVQHYIKHKRYLLKVECGHCKNGHKYGKACGKWELIEPQKEERRKSIKALLEDINKSLEEIRMILQSDEES